MKKIIAITSAVLISSALLTGITFAQTGTTSTDQTAALACVAKAVADREAKIQSAFSAFSSSMTSAFQTRASDLASAWAMSDKTARKEAIRNAWKKFSDSKRAARKTYNIATKTAWKDFKKAKKDCNLSKSMEERESEGADKL